LKGSDFGKQYFSVFGLAKDSASSNVIEVCRREGLDSRVTQKIVTTLQVSIDQTASNSYTSLWNVVKSFFRE
jgi:hypothetical protein